MMVLGAWGLSVFVGLGMMIKYQVTPGRAASAPATLSLPVTNVRGQLLVFLHPQCECSLATVDELQRLMTATRGAISAKLYFYKPSSESESWCRNTRLWDAARLIPSATLLIDTDAKVAKAYGSRCSGQVLLYSTTSRQLVFKGGLTESRGHEGGSAGEDAISEFARTGKCATSKTDVFGCAIW